MRCITFLMALCLAGQAWALPTIRDHFMDQAPEVKSMDELDKLVDYLIKPYKKDEDKAYVLLNWIVNFVDYDDYRYDKISENNQSHRDLSDKIPEQGDILKTRLGVCENISDLYVEMLKKADIPAQKIGGCIINNKNWEKGDNCDNPHAWTAVWLDKQWELVDPTFAMGKASALTDVRTNSKYKKEVKKRERRSADTYESRHRPIISRWFKASVSLMQDEHQPENEVWRLTKIKDRKNKNLK